MKRWGHVFIPDRQGAVLIAGLLLLMVFWDGCDVYAGEVDWKGDLKAAARESRRTQKPLLLEFTANWCQYCQKMRRTTFRDEGVIRHVNGCFVPVSVDYDRNEPLVKAVGVTVLPTTVVISPDLTVLKKITGYHTPAELRQQLKGLCPRTTAAERKDVPPTHGGSAVTVGAAFQGYCLVSMLDEKKLRKGQEKFSTVFRGKRLLFSSAAALKRFRENPRRYWPVNDGLCPVTRLQEHVLKEGSPATAAIYQQRIWFFAGPEKRKAFAADPKRFSVSRTASRK